MPDELDRLQSEFDRSDGGVHLVSLPTHDPLALFRAGHRSLPRYGFVPVMAARGSEARVSRAIRGRHVLIACRLADARAVTIEWVRLLAQDSPRRHLIAACGTAAAPVCGAGLCRGASSGFVSDRLRRAERWRRRGRARSYGRWLWAAAQGARRRGEQALGAQIEIQWALHASDRDLLVEADRRVRALLPTRLDWQTYCDASAVRTDVLIAREAFQDARAWLTSRGTEASLRGVELPGAIHARLAELDFWQARQPPGIPVERRVFRPGESVFRTPDEAGWRAIGAWSRGDEASVALIAAAHLDSAGTDDRAGWWRALTRVLMSSGCPEDEVVSRIDVLTRAGSATLRARLRRLGALIAARIWMTRGRSDRAAPLLERARGPGPEGSAATALRAQLNPPAIAVHLSAVRQPRSAPGVEFMASRSTSMHLVDGLSGLLAVIEDAENEGLVLVGGCRWVCRQSGATAVGVVSADGSLLVAAEGWTRADLGGEIAEILRGPARDARASGHDMAGSFGVSVRHGGFTIGFVVSRGLQSERPRVQQAAQAFAALCGAALRARLDAMAAPARARDLIPELVGDSLVIQAVRESVARAAVAPFPVLIEGESGTGKELVARALHRLGPRRDRKFCAVNCAALTDDLVEAELFGHVRGAFTGAIGPRAGLFEEASGGTLFLDEAAELSARAQAKLLRVLQEREIRRVGENSSRAIDVRVIAATNVGLAEAAAQGRFRDDLRFRLAVVRIRLPALRDRLEDVAPLARSFWRRAAGEAGTRATLGPDALVRLARHGWPGNVRELQNVVSGLVVAVPARGRVTARLVDQVIAQGGSSAGAEAPVVFLETARRTFERRVITAALVRHNGRRSAAATELGLTRQGLTKALRRLGLSADAEAETKAETNEDAVGVA